MGSQRLIFVYTYARFEQTQKPKLYNAFSQKCESTENGHCYSLKKIGILSDKYMYILSIVNMNVQC